MVNSNILEINSKLQDLVGEQSHQIEIGLFHIKIGFACGFEAYIRLHKKFKFRLFENEILEFEVNYRERKNIIGSGDFCIFSGSICSVIRLNNTEFFIEFFEKGYIIMDILPDDFEVFEVSFISPDGEYLNMVANLY